ncbi:MAG: PBP1A family penicillin-binding protein [Patescibacteria group bacterium]
MSSLASKIPKRIKNFGKMFFKKRVALLFLVFITLFVAFYIFILKDLPSPTRLSQNSASKASQIYDRNGELLFTFYSNKNQTFVPIATIPLTVQRATISIEDKDFYKHGPIDIKGIVRSAISIAFYQKVQGGSTLTQQLIKNSLLTPERTILRKVKEILLAFATEALYSKNKIMEMYLNQTPYGGTAWGIEAASQTYFGKSAKELSLAQSALLAGLPEAPSIYSPFGSRPELAKKRQEEVLLAMLDEKYITKDQFDKAMKEPLKYKNLSNTIKAPHFVLYVKDLLVQKYGEEEVNEGGLKITTSLDMKIQDMTQASVAAEIDRINSSRVTNAAAVVSKPSTGEILAMVGSKDYFDDSNDGNVNVTIAQRQPGSSIKPINYATGLIKGYSAATPFIDQKICFPNPGQAQYCPVNYDGKFRGIIQMRFALANSINIPAVKMLKINGIQSMLDVAKDMGISSFGSSDKYGLSLTLGGGEVTMLDMATAYGVFANGGYKIPLHPILKVADGNGKILEEYKPPQSPIFGKKVIPEGVAFIISDILSDNHARTQAFGSSSELRIGNLPVAVKTGTTNDFRDNWTIGYTPSYVTTVWVGNNDNRPMSGVASGVTGAAPIWNGIMTQLLAGKGPEPFQRPAGVIQKSVCADTGLIPNKDNPCNTRFEYFIAGTESKSSYQVLNQDVFVNKDTQEQAKEGDPNTEVKKHTVIKDATGDSYCVSCAHPTPTASPTPAP